MADDVEIVLAADDLRAVDVGKENGLTIRVRSRQEVAERIDDAAAAAADHGLRVVAERRAVVRWEVAPPVELVAGEHEAASLDRDVAHRGDPRIAGVSSRRAI